MPDLILMDICLPDGSGLAAGRAILERWPAARIIALTALEDRSAFDEALHDSFVGGAVALLGFALRIAGLIVLSGSQSSKETHKVVPTKAPMPA